MLKSKNILPVLGTVCVFLLFMHAATVFDRGDDYDIKLHLRNSSVWSFSVNEYLNFDGRSLNPGYLISRACLKSDISWLASVIATLFWLMTSYIAVLLAGMGGNDQKKKIILGVFVAVTMWLSSFFVLSDTLYYQTCTLYVVEIFFLFLNYLIFQKKHYHRFPLFSCLIFFLTGLSSPHATIALGTIIIAEYIRDQKTKQKKDRRFYLCTAAFLAGIFVVVLAPGNSHRLLLHGGFDQKQFLNIHNFYFILQQFGESLYKHTGIVTWIIAILGFIPALDRIARKRGYSGEILYQFRWLLAAFFTVFFFIPKGYYYLSSPRLNIHFIWFTFLFLASQYRYLGTMLSLHPFTKQLIATCTLVCFLAIGSSQWLNANHSAKKMKNRISLYKAHANKDLILKADDIIGPPVTHMFEDIQCDSSFWINKTTARYFLINSISKEAYR